MEDFNAQTRNFLRPVSAEDWERQRTTIGRLYATEGRTLHEVMDIMKQDYEFLATFVLL